MAVRLQMKLGVVAERDRRNDSPDTIVVVEPSVGSVARTKGSLYLLVTSRLPGSRPHEATRIIAETIRNEYYYDESAGIRDCLRKVIDVANKRLAHTRDRYGLGHSADGSGPIGVGIAVVRGHELYVATVGPAEAYLIRQARLSTLPDPHRERGLPAVELDPDVWRGEISVGDSLVLVSPNVVSRLGPTELKDAMLTLHPQAAMEHLHGRFVTAEGTGSDGAIAIEAMETSATQKTRTLVPVRPSEPLAGAPDRSPIPLADPVAGGVAAVQASARQARTAAGSVASRGFGRILDLLPARRTAYRRVTPLAAKRERQRRAAIAILAFIVVSGGLTLGVLALGSQSPGSDAIASITKGQAAIDKVRADLARVSGPGVDLVEDDPGLALKLMREAYAELDVAEAAKVPATTVVPLRTRVVTILDRLFAVVPVRSTPIVTLSNEDPPIDLIDLVRGPDGAPYVLDRGTESVYRINVEAAEATLVLRTGRKVQGTTVAAPTLLTAGGPDLVIVDARNDVWRWRPADDKGKGTTTRLRVDGASTWGEDVIDIGTFLRSQDTGFYNLYVIDPSEDQILSYAPARDGSGFPGQPSKWLAADRDVASMRSIYIDGDVFVIEGGVIERFASGRSDSWRTQPPEDQLLRPTPRYTLIASGDERRSGVLYAFDAANRRVVAYDKASGRYLEQYRIAGGETDWSNLRALYVEPGADTVPTRLIWISKTAVNQVALVRVPDVPTPTPTPEPTASADAEASGAAASGPPRQP